MPHQCLKCGELFNDGTTTILRGCPECKGTRFFFTEEGLGADERKRMLAGSEVTLREAIEELVKKAKDGQTLEEGEWAIAGPPPTAIVADATVVPPDLPDQIIPRIENRVTIVHEPDPKLVVKLPKRTGRTKGKREVRWDYVAPEPAPASPPLFSSTGLKDPLATKPAAAPPAPPAPAPAPIAAPEPVVAEPAPAKVSTPKTLDSFLTPPPKAEPRAPLASAEGAPETIRIDAPGQYEIDVKRLMEDSPVVIQKDGTYLIHLPSLFAGAPKQTKGAR